MTMRTLLAELKNITTQTEPKELASAQVVELGERDLILTIPKGCCAMGHALLVTLVFQEGAGADRETRFSATCVVHAIDAAGQGRECISVRLQQYGKKEWEDCLSLVSKRHVQIENLLAAVKGGEPPVVVVPENLPELKAQLASRKALVADIAPHSRSQVAEALVELGVAPANIVEVATFADAQVELTRHRPDIVLAEYRFDGFSGIELGRAFKVEPESIEKSVFILITTSVSQCLIAQAAEEDVDGQLMKPFTSTVLRKALQGTLLAKLKPTPYAAVVARGRGQLLMRHYEKAEAAFTEALALESRPTLAHYYLGAVALGQELFAHAESRFREGLGLSKLHSRCQLGLFEALAGQGRFDEAYEALHRYCQYFPPTPARLEEAVELAVKLGRHGDIERYLAIFDTVEEPEQSLVEKICRALVFCGQFYLGTQSKQRALELFKRALALARPFPPLLEQTMGAIKGIDPA